MTITSERDGGIVSIAGWLKRMVGFATTISVIIIVILYLIKYAHSLDIDYMTGILKRQFSGLDISSNISEISSRFNISYPFVSIVENVKGQPGFYTWIFRIMVYKAGQLFYMIRDIIQNFIN